MVGLKDLQPGQKLRIKTKNEVLIGFFEKLTLNETCLVLQNPKKIDGTILGKKKWIYESEITSIEAVNLKQHEIEDKEERKFRPCIVKQQINRIEKMTDGSVFIYQADMVYHQALLEIAENFIMGIAAENVDKGRIFKPDFLQIATYSKIYIFDLMTLNAKRLFNDLRSVLESDAYFKITFDSRLLLDNLNNHFNMKIQPICDLMVVLSLERETKLNNINDCIQEVFGFNPHIDINVTN